MKRLVIAGLTLVLVGLVAPIASAAPEPGGSFVDDDGSVHEGAIEAIAALAITVGCNPPVNDRFCPGRPVTRGQMAAFLSRALHLPPADSHGFVDTDGSVFARDIDRLAAAGITRGCNPPVNDRYCPDRAVTRGQMAAFLGRAFHLDGAVGDSFEDDDGSVFEADIERLHAAGITVGCNPPDNDRYCPGLAVTRGQMATFLVRSLGIPPIHVPPRPVVVDVVQREAWGAVPPTGSFSDHVIERVTIHHAGDLDGAVGPAQFRGWQEWHLHLGWPDLAYHFIVGRDGLVYEGRPYSARGDTATEYDPAGHLLIVVEGDFNDATPTAGQLEAVAQLVAWASSRFDLPVDGLTGHRDHAATTCPGDHLYAAIHDGSITARADELIAAGGVSIVID